ncbi:MAG: zinc ribbon domain-containing protein [Firmicutes bacterium]|nr:zinc ribbon domain-containing protein [Bacillota bacterium]
MKDFERIRKDSMKQYGFGTEAMKQIKICTNCRTPASINDAFCGECSFPLPKTTLYDTYKSRHRSCPGCGVVIHDNTDYCPQCGTRIIG